ncbi:MULTISPECIES: TrkH family potassium uptake protein [Pseudothermotoga]|jgi:trk system potassium uptake protein TrkH|uniref:Cation transporter n=1 Tax=Pseudothermotoga lettingae (strain ATCC BAA-301 / DSM 14385 / NBRC 107922 / TMO) TaxID=416591 RepID=A8F5M4_PSELT|nr:MULTISPECIES: TrkH family potassium uptake protein [Pseudothermotoga]ABV33458.1 cation transporter [Pseudothermotoga lettingae TMO]KUK20371.1 MAG: Cation transporter [Pseudothermotoga lettingae]MDI3495428.1 trk/ktr system potassium uptake protein [Pseudothermotoga sp.]MDK2883893.1 trk/ktr system potassium uptake protein [Pseudothermotoga sp.]GLI49628.1 potassium transporter [Pseudothermotoga lettingae TMO]
MNIYSKKSYAIVFRVLSSLLIFFSVILLVPLIFSIFYGEFFRIAYAFFIASAISILLAYIFRIPKREKTEAITSKEGALIVLMSWIIVIFLSSLPYYLSNTLTMSQAIFEATSGWTTTGLTMITDVENTSKSLLAWRSITQFLGGAGFAIIVMGAIIGPTGLGLYQAEGRIDNIVPNIRYSARIIMIAYTAYAIAGMIALVIAGMNFFDAFNHSLTALATGGFSTKNSSIGYYNSEIIEIIIMILMWLGATGFGIHYVFWLRNWKALRKNYEPKQMAFFTILGVTIVSLTGINKVFPDTSQALRHASFQVISALTGTGFSTVDLSKWSNFPTGMFVLTILMLLGGCMDSTSGGIKQYRITVLIKAIYLAVKKFLLPRDAIIQVEIWKGHTKKYLDDTLIREAFIIIGLYMVSYLTGVLVLTSHNYTLQQSMFEVASAIAGVGLSCGITTPVMPAGALWTLIVEMFLGRLEFLVVIYAIARIIRDLSSRRFCKKTAV